MARLIPIVIPLSLAFLFGCASRWDGPATVTDRLGREVCALHRVPLTREHVYVIAGFFSEVEAYARIRARYPNPWPAGFSPTKVDVPPFRWERATVSYCKQCDEAYDAAVRRRGM